MTGALTNRKAAWYLMPGNVKVRAVDVERVLLGQGRNYKDARDQVIAKQTVWGDASARTFYEWRVP